MPLSHKRIFLIPLDSRPVCYDLPRRLASVAGVTLGLPSANLLGRLKKPANFKTFNRWVKNHLFEKDPLIVALDTVAFGGLIPSRLNTDSLEILQNRVKAFFQMIQADACLGFSSILRIPNYNSDEEEPAYWHHYGRQLYEYSSLVHQQTDQDADELGNQQTQERSTSITPDQIAKTIPADVLFDFLERHQKNARLNEGYLGLVKRKTVDYLVYCQDDTGPWGLNVQQAEKLAIRIQEQGHTDHAHIQTGADEVASCLLARWMVRQQEKPLRIYPFYSAEGGRQQIARFDGIPIADVVEKAIRSCGAQLASKSADADLWLMVHTPDGQQGDHCSGESARTNPEQAEMVLKILEKGLSLGKPVALADVAYANGGDPRLMEKLVTHFEDLTGLYGYAAWNTPGNTIGTTVAMALIRLVAEANQCFNAEAFCQLMFIRLVDDWLYQSEVRQLVRKQASTGPQSDTPLGSSKADETLLNVLMADGVALLKNRLGLENRNVHCRYPCNRTFEVEVCLT